MRTYEEYLAALVAGDVRRAVAALEHARRTGASEAELVRDVIGPAQARIGSLWAKGALDVADEHLATTVAEEVLATIWPPAEGRQAPLVLLACSEGEWHSFPPRLAARLAAVQDLRVLSLGGSISADHLRRAVRNARPAAVALSTTMTANLVGAARSIRAVCEEGTPVLVGGAAWGSGQARALRLGANGRVEDPSRLAEVVHTLKGPRRVEELPRFDGEVIALDPPPHDLVRLSLVRHRAWSEPLRRLDQGARQEWLEALTWLARDGATALLCDEPAIVREAVDWLAVVAVGRGLPAAAAVEAAQHLADSLDAVAPRTAWLLREQVTASAALPA